MKIRLEAFYIENFRSIRKVVLENLSETCVFIGKNNAGKSNILRAIKCFFEVLCTSTASSKEVFTKNDLNEYGDIRIKGIINMDGVQYLVTVKTMLFQDTLYSFYLVEDIHNFPSTDSTGINIDSGFGEYFFTEMAGITLLFEEINEYKMNISSIEEDISKLPTYELKVSPLESLSFVEQNLALSDYSMDILRNYRFQSRDLYDEVRSILNNGETILYKKIDDLFGKIMEKSEDISQIWSFTFPDFVYIPEKQSIRVPTLLSLEKIFAQPEEKLAIDENDVTNLYILKNKKEHSARWNRIRALAQKILGIQLDVFLDETNNPSLDVDKKWINLNGTGIREVLRTILDLEMKDLDTVLIEEPEVHLHFDLEQKLSKYLLSKGAETQIFMTTHSTAFIETARNQSVFLVNKDLNETEERIITKAEQLSANYFVDAAKEVGLNVSALLIKRLLVYVEGKTDRMIFEQYLSKYHDDVFETIGFVDMKGESNYEHYATAKSMEVFKDSQLRTFFILDTDNLSEAQIQKKKEDHPKDGSEIHFWSGACIETMFLSPVILLKFIRSKTGRQDIALENVKEKMEKVFEEIKHNAMRKYLREKLLKPLYPKSQKKNGTLVDVEAVKNWFEDTRKEIQARANEEVELDKAIAEFETDWNINKGIIVPGDKFLEAFCKEYSEYGNFTYSKDENNIRHLVGALEENEWPEEFKAVANRIIDAVMDRNSESVV